MSEIRVRNDTGEALDDVRISVAEGSRSLGPLAPAAESSWQPVETVHRYPAVEASGRYTYVLRLDGGRLVVDLEEG